MLTHESGGPLVVKGHLAVDVTKFPALHRAIRRGQDFITKMGQSALAAPVNGNKKHQEDDMSKTAKRSKGGKSTKAKRVPTVKKGERDPRIPATGSVITREYKGKSLEVKVLDEGFEHAGEKYTSLSALAKVVTGAKSINGLLFFKLTEPKKVEAK